MKIFAVNSGSKTDFELEDNMVAEGSNAHSGGAVIIADSLEEAEEILKKVVEKLKKKNGNKIIIANFEAVIRCYETLDGKGENSYSDLDALEDLSFYLYHHQFAKTFFPPNPKKGTRLFTNWYMEEVWANDVWEYELQNMVLEKDPIKYLEEFI